MSLDFSGLVNVGGNLNIQYLNNPSYVSHNLSFPLLETIGGNFYVYYYYGENLIAPSLTTVGGYLQLYYCNYLTDIRLPALQTIGSYLQLYNLYQLSSINFQSLLTIGDSLQFSSLSQLSSINFQSLLTIGDYFSMSSSSALDVLEFPVLDTVGSDFSVSSSGTSTGRISLPLLTQINGYLTLSSTTYPTFDAPMLERVVEDLYVSNSYNLVDFNVPKLSEVATSSSNSYGRKKPRASLSRSHL